MRPHYLPLLALTLALSAGAQDFSPPRAYAITHARVEVGDGTNLPQGTVLIRDGLIEAVGADLPVPPDAETIDGAGLVVYPGFTDALTSTGLDLPAAVAQQDAPRDTSIEAPATMREANRAGVRPELRAASYVSLTEAQLVPLHQAGFTTALLAPTGGILDGVGALVELGGRPRRESVVASPVLHAGFRTTRGSYPGSLLGVFSQFRQTLLDAQRYRRQQNRFRAYGGVRPPADEVLEALQPVLAGELPLLWDADTEREIRRALALSDEFGFRLVFAGGAEAWKVAPLLAERKIPVVVALAFPPEPRAPRTGMGTETPAAVPPANPPAMPPTDDETPEAARADRKRLADERVTNALQLQKAGVTFAFTSRGTRNPADFMANVRKAVAAGLPPPAALSALTRGPAVILGVDRHAGTIAPGKAANLTVTTAPFTEATAKVRWMFIAGRRLEPEKETVSSPMPTAMPLRPRDDDEQGGR